MAPKRSCKGKKRSKKCSRRKSSCPKKPSLFMDDIRWMQFKKAAQEAVQAWLFASLLPSDDIREEEAIKKYTLKFIPALNNAWKNFYTNVNPSFITSKFLNDASNELDMALVPLFIKYPKRSNFYPFKTSLIIEALNSLKSPIKIE